MGPTTRRPQQRGQDHEECRMRLHSVGGIAEVLERSRATSRRRLRGRCESLGSARPSTTGRSRSADAAAPGALPPPGSAPRPPAPMRSDSGPPPGRRGSGDRARPRAGPRSGVRAASIAARTPAICCEHRLRRLCRPRGGLGLGPRLLLVREAGQGLLEVGDPSRERIQPGGCQELPLRPGLLHPLERLERRLLPQEAQRPLEFEADEGADLGKLLSRPSRSPAWRRAEPDRRAGAPPPPWPATPPPRAGSPGTVAGPALLAGLTASGPPPRRGRRASAQEEDDEEDPRQRHRDNHTGTPAGATRASVGRAHDKGRAEPGR